MIFLHCTCTLVHTSLLGLLFTAREACAVVGSFLFLRHSFLFHHPFLLFTTVTALSSKIFDGSKQKQRGVHLFQHHFVKVEDMSGKYRPFYHEYEKYDDPIPFLNFHTQPSSCPFDPRVKASLPHKPKGREQVCWLHGNTHQIASFLCATYALKRFHGLCCLFLFYFSSFLLICIKHIAKRRSPFCWPAMRMLGQGSI